MTTRREFLSSMAAAGLAAQPVFRERAMRSLFRANAIAGDRSPQAVADDESYWAEIQRAFDSDRTMINLNNGGCSPTPSHVLEAMIRDLRFSNELPVEHMWRVLEPRVESVRRDLATEFGADAEEMAIVRNASEANENMIFGLDLKKGDEIVTSTQNYPRMLTSWDQRVRRDGIVVKKVTFPLPPKSRQQIVDRFAEAITPRTRVIMPVHMAGLMADMDALDKLASDAGIRLLQDAAHAHGARWQGRRVGELDSVAAFSFQNGKLMTAGEGGAVLFPDADEYEQAFLHHSCGRPRTDRRYHHQVAGTNMRMNEFSAAVLRAQLGRLDSHIELREQRWRFLSALLAEIPGVRPQGADSRADRNPHYMAMFRLPGWSEDRRNLLVDRLVEAGIPAFAAFRAIYRTAAFWEIGAPEESVDAVAQRCPNADAISQDCLWLHHRTLLGSEQALTDTAAIVADLVAAG